jgi:hypothetical protein
MPRTMDPVLLALMDCADPDVCLMAEVSAPDMSRVLRRWDDQFSAAPYRVSETPAATTASTFSGGMTLTSTDVALVSLFNSNASDGLDVPDISRVVRGVAWTPAAGMSRVLLRQFVARLKRSKILRSFGLWQPSVDMQLQIYRPTARLGYLTKGSTETLAKQYTFEPLLAQPAIVRYSEIGVWGAPLGTDEASFAFSLTHANLMLGPLGIDPIGADVRREPYLMFVVSPVNAWKNDLMDWRVDNTSGTFVAGVGTFNTKQWQRSDPSNPVGWALVIDASSTNAFKMLVAQFAATSQIVYSIAMDALPSAPSVGRIVFERAVPEGAAALLELSTAGIGGPWVAVKHGDVVAVKQVQYHLRVTLTASPDLRRAPSVSALGIEFRVPVDVSLEASAQLPPKEVSIPFLAAGIGEGSLKVIRTGERDYHDAGTELAANYPTTKLEADLYLGSRNPLVTRAQWLLMDRASVTNRLPSQTSESFTLLSYLKVLKRKIPQRIEAINSVHTITGSPTDVALSVTPALPDTSPGNHEYNGKKYYIRVRSAADATAERYTQVINGSTGTTQLDFATTAPIEVDLAAGDVIEVHSGTFAQPALEWIDADPAAVWWEILTVHLEVPPERIGRGDLGRAGRAGLPPTVLDRAPGDATTQAKLLVTLKLTEAEEASALVDQLSFIMGGCTTEIGGQIVYRQVYPLLDARRVAVVQGESPAAIFDARDYRGLSTPTGVEQRLTTIACDYGVNTTVTDEQPTKTVVFADGDAVAWLATQDVEGLGYSTVPDEIARWCYNSNDEGLYLATELARRVVEAGSTGLREWSWTCPEPKPWLCLGDVVVITTDQYTDYDPRRNFPIAGLWSFPVVLVGISNGGRDFRGFMLGLQAALPALGGPGVLGAQPLPLLPTLDVSSSEGTTETVFTVDSTGAVEYKIDSGLWTALVGTTLNVARNAANGPSKSVQFRASRNGQTNYSGGAFNVPPQVATPPAASITDVSAGVISYFADKVRVSWTFTGLGSGWYMVVERSVNSGAYAVASPNLTASPFDDDSTGLDLVPSGGSAATIDYRVKMYNSLNVLQVTSSVYRLNTHSA